MTSMLSLQSGRAAGGDDDGGLQCGGPTARLISAWPSSPGSSAHDRQPRHSVLPAISAGYGFTLSSSRHAVGPIPAEMYPHGHSSHGAASHAGGANVATISK